MPPGECSCVLASLAAVRKLTVVLVESTVDVFVLRLCEHLCYHGKKGKNTSDSIAKSFALDIVMEEENFLWGHPFI